MLEIWQKEKKGELQPVTVEDAFPFLLENGHVVSLIGGGGKTTLLYEMAGYGVRAGKKVLVTTSTHIYRPPEAWRSRNLTEIKEAFQKHGMAIVGSDCGQPEKLSMPEKELFEAARENAGLTLIEADGAKHLPCKAFAAWEPALLPCSDIVIGVTGLSALGQPLEKVCFRADLAAEMLGCSMKHRLCGKDLVRLITDRRGQKKNLEDRKFYVVLHQFEEEKHRETVLEIMELLKEQDVEHVFAASVGKEQLQSLEKTEEKFPWHGRAELPCRTEKERGKGKTDGGIYAF